MSRTALLVGAVVLAFGAVCPALAQRVYQCVPYERRATAPDRLVSVEVTLRPDGGFASVIYRAANGAAYDRGKQYETANGQYATGQHHWFGTLRGNPNVAIVGSLKRNGDRLVYYETIHDQLQRGKVVSQVTSICEPMVAEAPPREPAVPTPQPTPAPQPNQEAEAARNKVLADAGREYNECIQTQLKEIVPFSNEGAETLAQAITTKCADREQHFVDLGMAIYGMSRAEVQKTIADTLETRKRNIVADIVTFRAELTKALVSRPKSEEAPKSNSGQGL